MNVELANGGFTQIDDADWPLVSPYVWRHYTKRRLGSSVTYADARVTTNGKWGYLQMHRLILGLSDPRVQVDHRNRDGLDNRRANLRVATNSQNHANQDKPITNTSGYKGVSRNRTNKLHPWFAQIGVNRKQLYLGCFSTPAEAALAYDRAALQHFGEFARLNFPPTATANPNRAR